MRWVPLPATGCWPLSASGSCAAGPARFCWPSLPSCSCWAWGCLGYISAFTIRLMSWAATSLARSGWHSPSAWCRQPSGTRSGGGRSTEQSPALDLDEESLAMTKEKLMSHKMQDSLADVQRRHAKRLKKVEKARARLEKACQKLWPLEDQLAALV